MSARSRLPVPTRLRRWPLSQPVRWIQRIKTSYDINNIISTWALSRNWAAKNWIHSTWLLKEIKYTPAIRNPRRSQTQKIVSQLNLLGFTAIYWLPYLYRALMPLKELENRANDISQSTKRRKLKFGGTHSLNSSRVVINTISDMRLSRSRLNTPVDL